MRPFGIEQPVYVFHQHRATHLHFDLRLEHRGVLLSWAVPKGPSCDPGARRLAVRVDDHPLEYATFEGRIPEGRYGAGEVIIWDHGWWEPHEDDVDAALAAGHLGFDLHGTRLAGGWGLVRLRGDRNWLLVKAKDVHACPGGPDLLDRYEGSSVSGRTLDDIANDPDAPVWMGTADD